ncbi:GhoT/OrtT family toxin [Escherichia coli]|uniref:GhoT/OrtT family toxin n=1 Tax=Escherichia coli TaxID=562 RepID=UPI0028748323|nr:GhoT/OrtT family toxin [Escherichia coli]MDS0560958.1 GhoT/OrtT family toxin [Escherichia coli]MDS0572545.1 GhoT/OrtT family toxin [Escherichia coli]
MGEISVKTGNNARNGGKNSLNRLIRCVCGKKIGPDPRNFNQRVNLGRNDLLIRTFLSAFLVGITWPMSLPVALLFSLF